MKRILVILYLAGVFPGLGEDISVFDMPRIAPSYNQLMELVQVSHEKGDYRAMASFSQAGLLLGADRALWLYNQACAENLLGHSDKAMDILEESLKTLNLPVEEIVKDKDFSTIVGTPRFKALIEQYSRLPARKKPLSPITRNEENRFVQTAANTSWNMAISLFSSTLLPPPQTQPYRGLMAKRLEQWEKEGSAAPHLPLVYVNRDRHATRLSETNYPSMLHLGYDPEITRRDLDAGLPNTFFLNGKGEFIPAFGNASIRSRVEIGATAFSTSFSLFAAFSQETMAAQTLLLLFNQLYFYPAGIDYAGDEDRFFANNPLSIGVAGEGGSEMRFLETAIAATQAMRPEVRRELIARTKLGTTLNMLFRASQKGIDKPEDYLSGKAHPVIFLPERLDSERMVEMAHRLKAPPPDPPLLTLPQESPSNPGLDFFETRFMNELNYTTPFAISRIFRGKAPVRQYLLRVNKDKMEQGTKLKWVLLQGDPKRVIVQRIKDDPYAVLLSVAYHPVFKVAQPPRFPEIKTSRVDIAAIAEREGSYSMPSILSIYFLPSETRQHSNQGRVLSIDYTLGQKLYQIPTLSDPKQWKDEFTYSPSGDFTGWTRIRGNSKSTFTPHGLKVVTRDDRGRADKVHQVRYIPRYLSDSQDPAKMKIDVAEIDDQDTLFYAYKSDGDLLGTPRKERERSGKKGASK